MDGLLPVLKPKGWTSFDVVRKLQHIIRHEKIGHAGNLDTLATGLLLIGIGSATKQLSSWLNADKEYTFLMQFGITTETLDSEGHSFQYANVDPAIVNADGLKEVIQQYFLGEILQRPPQYCALKIHGKRYADLAREKIDLDPPERKIMIHSMEVKNFVWDNMHPSAILKLHCSHGTYVRALCRDIASKLHTVGMAKEICRTRIGNITLDDAVLLSDLTDIGKIPTFFYKLVPA